MESRSDPAYDVVVEDQRGEPLLVHARSGRFQLVHFWATWCPPCRKEFPTLLEMARRNQHRLQVWAVSVDREWAAVREFHHGELPSIVVRDPTGESARSYGVSELPDSYLIDPQGRIRAKFAGAQHWSAPEMDRILDELMLER